MEEDNHSRSTWFPGIATVTQVGFITGRTTLKNVWIGVQPSIMAASSISIGMDFYKTAEHKYRKSCSISKINDNQSPRSIQFQDVCDLERVNITIWNGTTMENRHSMYMVFVSVLVTRLMYQAHMEVQSRITATENTVINNVHPNAWKIRFL